MAPGGNRVFCGDQENKGTVYGTVHTVPTTRENPRPEEKSDAKGLKYLWEEAKLDPHHREMSSN